jgi:hypothetical protein
MAEKEKKSKKRKNRGRPSIAELYGETETVALKITVTAKQYEYLTIAGEDLHETPGEILRSLIALAMAIEADEMPDDYNAEMWRDLRRMIRGLRLDLAGRRGGS